MPSRLDRTYNLTSTLPKSNENSYRKFENKNDRNDRNDENINHSNYSYAINDRARDKSNTAEKDRSNYQFKSSQPQLDKSKTLPSNNYDLAVENGSKLLHSKVKSNNDIIIDPYVTSETMNEKKLNSIEKEKNQRLKVYNERIKSGKPLTDFD